MRFPVLAVADSLYIGGVVFFDPKIGVEHENRENPAKTPEAGEVQKKGPTRKAEKSKFDLIVGRSPPPPNFRTFQTQNFVLVKKSNPKLARSRARSR